MSCHLTLQAARAVWRLPFVTLVGLTVALAACAPAAPAPGPATAAAVTPVGPLGPAPSPTVAPLTGRVSRGALESHPGWESLRAQDYTPEPRAVAKIRASAAKVEVLAFIGTWCPDSRREVPRLLKLLDQVGVPASKVTMLGLDRSKRDAEGLTERWGLKYVPTFIILEQGRELGRVVEKSQATLEADLVQILASSVPLTLSGSRPELRTVELRPTATPAAAPAKTAEPATLSVQEVKALLDTPNRPPLFDARPKASYDAGHLPGAISLPLDELERRIEEVPRDRLSIFYCIGKT